jgi:hypothetical protein
LRGVSRLATGDAYAAAAGELDTNPVRGYSHVNAVVQAALRRNTSKSTSFHADNDVT